MDDSVIPVKVYCLGHFRAERAGVPLEEITAVQRKPLALLKVLIALGGRNIPEDQLTESLWPDSDGDAAHRAFTSALHRLRQTLGADALQLRQRQLSLDSRQIWCDALEFDALVSEAARALAESNPGAALSALERALFLYRGPFLVGEFEPPEILGTRERLHGRFLRVLREGGRVLEDQGRFADAIRLYQQGLEADPVSEELARCLMRACARESRFGEAEAAYLRLGRNLEGEGAKPSAETEALHAEFLAETRPESATYREKPSIAVLPLSNMSGDPSIDYFCDGLAEDLITDLSQYTQLSVVARNSSFQYKRKAVDVREVGRHLGVRYVLEGSVRAVEGSERARINFQLANAESGVHVWAERYDRPLQNMFALQEEIVDKVVQVIDVKLIEGGQTLGRRRSAKDYAAYRLFRRGNELFEARAPGPNRKAVDLFVKAVEIDPGFAMAWANLGYAYLFDYYFGWSEDPPRIIQLADQYAERALEIDPQLVEGHMLKAEIFSTREAHEQAVAEAERALALDQDNADAVGVLGYF